MENLEPKRIKIIFKIDPAIQNFGVNKVYEMRNFIRYCVDFLKIKGSITVILKNDKDEHLQTLASYAYNPEMDSVYIRAGGRHIVDIMRSIAHELVHKKQNEEKRLDDKSGITGSEQENEANSTAGVIMRNYTKMFPKILDL